MSSRAPEAGPERRERARLVQKLLADLDRFKRVPLHRRAAECADEGEETCQTLLRELMAHHPVDKPDKDR